MGRMIAAALLPLLLGTPATAQVTCRPTALGSPACVGLPIEPPRVREPYSQPRRGLGAVQARPGASQGPRLTPARRRDRLGNTFLTARDLPPSRPIPGVAGPRDCDRDRLGNLVCR